MLVAHLALEPLQVALEVGFRVADLHRAPAEHVGGAHQQREADLARHGDALLGVCAMP